MDDDKITDYPFLVYKKNRAFSMHDAYSYVMFLFLYK